MDPARGRLEGTAGHLQRQKVAEVATDQFFSDRGCVAPARADDILSAADAGSWDGGARRKKQRKARAQMSKSIDGIPNSDAPALLRG